MPAPAPDPASEPVPDSHRTLGAYTFERPPFFRWPKVQALHNMAALHSRRQESLSITYAPSVKIDGTNAGIIIWPDGRVDFQSRNRVLSRERDNHGFYKKMAPHTATLAQLAQPDGGVLVLYGEFTGPRTSGHAVAARQLPDTVLLLFAVGRFQPPAAALQTARAAGEGEPDLEALAAEYLQLDLNPAASPLVTQLQQRLPWVRAVPLRPERLRLHLHPHRTAAELCEHEAAMAQANALVTQVAARDPLMQQLFGLEGAGEGLVFVPLQADSSACMVAGRYATTAFKAVAPQFREEVCGKAAVRLQAAAGAGADDGSTSGPAALAAAVCTPARLQKVLFKLYGDGAVDGTRRLVSVFIKAFVEDVVSETAAERQAYGCNEKDLRRLAGKWAASWYLTSAAQLLLAEPPVGAE